MKKFIRYFTPLMLLVLFVLTGCGDHKASAPEAAVAETIELTSEEEALLESVAADKEEVVTEPVTSENYEEALKELEAALAEEN